MKLKPFQLERWLLKPCTYDLASAGITKLKLRDLTPSLDPEMLLNYGMTNGSERIRKQIAALYRGVNERADKDYTTLCHSGIGEYLATLALEPANFGRYVERAKTVIREHRTILADWIASHRTLVSWVPPVGGHTAFVRYHLGMDSETLARQTLAETGVLVSPGDHFESPHHLRMRISSDRDTLVKGLEAFGGFLERRAQRR